MKLISDKPFGLSGDRFICLGMISDSDKDYACLLDTKTGKEYIEEIHWGRGHNIWTATLHFIENEKEWIYLFNNISKLTTIFSPRKINEIMKQPNQYFYTTKYKETEDYKKRKENKLI